MHENFWTKSGNEIRYRNWNLYNFYLFEDGCTKRGKGYAFTLKCFIYINIIYFSTSLQFKQRLISYCNSNIFKYILIFYFNAKFIF